MTLKRNFPALCISTAVVLVGCEQSADQIPPVVERLSAPATINPRSSIEIAAKDNVGVTGVRLFAKTSTGDLLIGESTSRSAPYVISPRTQKIPNLSNLEIYAEARDTAGLKANSETVKVQVADDLAPALDYFAGFTYPQSAVMAQSLSGELLTPEIQPEEVMPPAGWHSSQESAIALQATALEPSRAQAVEWGFRPVSGALGYNVYSSDQPITGYELVQGLRSVQGDPLIRHAKFLPKEASEQQFGVITVLGSGGESAFSQASQARFLPTQELATPIDGQDVIGGRPTLTWSLNPSDNVSGYLFFVYKQNPEQVRSVPVWSSREGQSTSATNAVYPSDRPALSAGIYYWRVAAVSFNSRGTADGFSYSPVRTFVVK